jgi:hypothetical protein
MLNRSLNSKVGINQNSSTSNLHGLSSIIYQQSVNAPEILVDQDDLEMSVGHSDMGSHLIQNTNSSIEKNASHMQF